MESEFTKCLAINGITNLLILHYCNFTSYFHKFPILPPIQTFNFCPSAISRVIFSNFRNWRQFTYAILTLLQFHELFSQDSNFSSQFRYRKLTKLAPRTMENLNYISWMYKEKLLWFR